MEGCLIVGVFGVYGSIGLQSWMGGVGYGWVSVAILVMLSFAYELVWIDGRVCGDRFVTLHECEWMDDYGIISGCLLLAIKLSV